MREHLQKAMEIADGKLVQLVVELENGDVSVLHEYFFLKQIKMHLVRCIELLDNDSNSQI